MPILFRALFLRAAGPVCLSVALALSSPTHSQLTTKAIRAGQTAAQPAAQVVVPNRVSATADWSRLQPLRNHVPLWANAQNSTGAAAAEMTLTMVLSRSPEQQAALDQLLADQKNPAAPEFHHWLTPVEFGQRFGLSESDLSSVTGWLQAQGLRITFISPSRSFIGFAGSAAAVGHAFGTEIRTYSVNGNERISAASDPMIPAAVVPVVKGIRGLYTIDEEPHHLLTEPQQAGDPSLTLSVGTNFITPADFGEIYDWYLPTASGYQQTIGIVGRSRVDFDDLRNFSYIAHAPLQMPTEIIPTAFGGVDPGPAYTTTPPSGVSFGEQGEATLDVTRAGSVAMNANILLVVATSASGGIGADAQYLVQSSPVPAQVMNISYGACEANAGQSGVDFWDTLFEQAAAEGISVFVSSGDSGAAGCEQAFTTPLASPPAISPNYICSSSYVTCVGGTEFNDSADPSQYWSTGNGTNLSSAQKYIPEGGWNEPTASKGGTQVAGTGGGVSAFVPTPKWQTGPGVPAARAGRYTPDLSFSGSCHDAYFGCLAAAGAGCAQDSQGSFRFVGICGTSASAPSMAGVAALLDEKMQYPQGNLNPEIYAMAQNQPSSFHDATLLSSGVTSCDIHTSSMCNNSTPGPTGLTGGQAGYALTTGYDMVTGVGSVDIANFITNFATSLPQPTITVTPSSQNITVAQSLTFTVKVDGGSGPVPTGIIKLSSWAYTAPDATLVNGVATFDIPAYTLPGDINVMVFNAHYVPDDASSPVYLDATGSTQVAVNMVGSTMTVTPSLLTLSTAQDESVTVTIAGPSGAPTPTGSILVTVVANSLPSYNVPATLSGGSATVILPAGVLAPGSDRIDVLYLPDAAGGRVYSSSQGEANITVTQASKSTPTMNATLSSPAITRADAVTLNVKVISAPGAPAPTGVVSYSVNSYGNNANLSGGTAQFVIDGRFLRAGTDTILVNYGGDSNNNLVSASPTITVNKMTPAITVTPSPSTITPSQSVNVNIAITAPEGFGGYPGGTVTVASGAYTSGPITVAVGSAFFSIPAGSLATGTDTLTATYSGDNDFTGGTASATVTVNTVPPSLTVGGSAISITSAGATTGNTSTITVTPAGGFTGSVALTAAITSSPAGAVNIPTLSFGSTTPVTISGSNAATATLTVTTTATTTSELTRPAPLHKGWYAAGETALAFLVLFGLPAHRRRKWLSWTAMLLLAVAASFGIAACGGGGNSVTPPRPVTHPGTTAGTYVVTVTAASGSITANTTLNVNVQ